MELMMLDTVLTEMSKKASSEKGEIDGAGVGHS